MHVVVDEPRNGQEAQSSRVHFRGWVWLGHAQRMMKAVEVWSGDLLLGTIEALHPRSDVAANLGFEPSASVGFDLFVDFGPQATGSEQDFCVRILTTSGSRMGPFCLGRVRIGSSQSSLPVTGDGFRVTLDRPVASQAIGPAGFFVSGWLWAASSPAQREIEKVEVWCGATELGSSELLFPRPDVAAALGLPADEQLGFQFRARTPGDVAEFELTVRVKMRSGAVHGPYCGIQLRTASDLVAALETKSEELAAAHQVVAGLQEKVLQLTTALDNLQNPVPPDHLQRRQTGAVAGPLFYTLGLPITDDIAGAFASAGLNLASAKKILDFGCGCGRVLCGLRDRLQSSAPELWGCDIDAEAIAWNQAHIGRYAQFVVNGFLPPLPFPEAYFDAVFSVSVFTHLPEDMQFAWLAELQKVVRPGGVIVASVHGEHYWQGIHPDITNTVRKNGFDYRSAERTEGLPDFYMVAFHSATYIRERWGKYFEVIGIVDRGINRTHDAVMLRRFQ